MPDPIDVLAFVVLAFFGSRLVVGFRRSLTEPMRRRAFMLYKGIRWRHLWPVPIVVGLVLVAAWLLVQLPLLKLGWWSLLGGVGNPVFGVTDATAGTLWELIVPLVFVVLLIPALPLFVLREEEMFRLGAEAWSTPKRVWKALSFGLAHALVGIPVGVALALSIGGGWFTIAYLRGARRGGVAGAGLLESTRSHLAYNATIVALVLVALLLDLVLYAADAAL